MPRYEAAGIQPVQGPNGIIGALERHRQSMKQSREIQLAKETIADPEINPDPKSNGVGVNRPREVGARGVQESCQRNAHWRH